MQIHVTAPLSSAFHGFASGRRPRRQTMAAETHESMPETRRTNETLHVAMAGPIYTEPLLALLGDDADDLPKGLGGTPVWQLVRDLVDRGQRVSVVSLDPSVRVPRTASGPLLDMSYGPYRPRHRMRDFMLVEREAVRDAVVRARPDLVHAYWCGEYALGALASGLPTLVTVRDWMPAILRLTRARHLPYWSGRALLYFTTLAMAKHLTANSPYTAARVRRFTRASLEVVPNGMPDSDFLTADREEVQSCVPHPSRPAVISVNNGFGARKNVRPLVRAHHALRQRGLDCVLHMIGAGYEQGGPCAAWARAEGLDEATEFLGPLDRGEVLRRLRTASLLVHPAREESFGMTLIEAMSQRTPVIGGATSGAVPWVLDGGRAGLLVDVGNPRSIANAIEAVLTQETLSRRLACEGFSHAWERFRQSKVTDLYLDVYRRLLNEVGVK